MTQDRIEVDDFLRHYGVEGMKWGKNRTVEEIQAAVAAAAAKAGEVGGDALDGASEFSKDALSKGDKFVKSFFDEKQTGNVPGREFRALPDKKGKVTKFLDKLRLEQGQKGRAEDAQLRKEGWDVQRVGNRRSSTKQFANGQQITPKKKPRY